MWLVSAMYLCHDCGKDYEGANAMGLAALHHKKTGHHTSVQMVYAQHFPKQEKTGKEVDHVKTNAG